MSLCCDAVFEGGGVRGLGFAGAVGECERQGYRFRNVAGSSAGAIAGALIAAGYTGEEMLLALSRADFNAFRQEGGWSRLDGPGKLVNLTRRYGVYKADAFENWLSELLRRKGVERFGDIAAEGHGACSPYTLTVVASDLTDNRILVLPQDLKDFGLSPDSFPVARAVRMSMSIPLYYEPVRLADRRGRVHLIVDGGLLSNYPIWLLDDGTSNPPRPTFAFKFISSKEACKKEILPTGSFVDYLKAIVTTMLEAGDNYHISQSKGDLARSILISTQIETPNGPKTITTTDFDITPAQGAQLAQNGRQAARRFLNRWDFARWKKIYR